MIKLYENKYEAKWDELVLDKSKNGNFLQTRRFLNYHPKNKYKDYSLMIFKGETLVAVIPANICNCGKKLISHEGSTFGGLIIDNDFCSTTNYKWMFEELMDHIYRNNFECVELRVSNWIYRRLNDKNEALDYFFQLNGFSCQFQIGFFIDLSNIDENYEAGFEPLKRRNLRKAYGFNLSFRELRLHDEITEFYDVLTDNMLKFGIEPLHTVHELLDYKYSRLNDIVSFYGVYYEGDMIAGSMVFNFCNKKVFHTQYLASRHDYLQYHPNEFLYSKLILEAKNSGFKFISFGTATLNDVNDYNASLAIYKEGFNADTYVNYLYRWERNL